MVLTSGRSLRCGERAMGGHDSEGSSPRSRRSPHVVILGMVCGVVTDVVGGWPAGCQRWRVTWRNLQCRLTVGVGDKRVYLTIRQRMNGRLLVEAELRYDIHAGPMTF